MTIAIIAIAAIGGRFTAPAAGQLFCKLRANRKGFDAGRFTGPAGEATFAGGWPLPSALNTALYRFWPSTLLACAIVKRPWHTPFVVMRRAAGLPARPPSCASWLLSRSQMFYRRPVYRPGRRAIYSRVQCEKTGALNA